MFYICAMFIANSKSCVAVIDTDDDKVEVYEEVKLQKLCKKAHIRCMSYEEAESNGLPIVVREIPSHGRNVDYTCQRKNARCTISVVWSEQGNFPQAIPREEDYQVYFYPYDDCAELGVAANEQHALLSLFMRMVMCIYTYKFSI